MVYHLPDRHLDEGTVYFGLYVECTVCHGRKRGSKSKLYLWQQEHGVTGHMSIVRKQGMLVLGSLSPLSFSL